VLVAAAEVAGDWRASAAGAGGDPVVVTAGGVAVASAGGLGAGVGQSYFITVATVAFWCHLDCI